MSPGPKEQQMKRGDFHGEETLVLENEHLHVEVLADAGPRIVRLQLGGSSENLLGEVPDVGWDTPWGRYRLRGGHRLWVAPESPPFASAPEGGALVVDERPRGVRLERLEPETGLRKAIELELAADRAAVTVIHSLRNENETAVVQAPWAITILPLGGVAVLPQQRGPIGESDSEPNRSLAFWPYGSISDSRLELGDELVLVRAEPVPATFKIGYLNRSGWVAFLRDGVLFCKHFDPQVERAHADLNSNVEVYCDARLLELETLAPLSRLEPGAEAEHEERWELHRVGTVEPSIKRLTALLTKLELA
ncbi:MAG: hypothetical protein ABSC36_03400 [Gaiellaceae bacterium]